jgi:RHS repeat-associated protein
MTHDDLGQLIRATYPDGTFEETAYDDGGRRVGSKDEAARATNYEYDRLGRMTKTTFPDGSFTQTGYDLAGRMIASTDARGKVTTYGYDNAGRRTAVTDALSQTTTYGYDDAGRNTTIKDARSFTTFLAYDEVNRQTATTFADSTRTTTAYDQLGQRTSETDQVGRTTSFGYDFEGRLVAVTDALSQVTRYTYDDVGNRVSQVDANMHETRFEYDKLGRQTKRVLPDGKFETTVYDAHGRRTSRTDFMGQTTAFQYDQRDRLTLKRYPDTSTVSFTYTATGRRLTVVDARGTTSYNYDPRDRPTQLTYPDGRHLNYEYDSAGNRTSLTATVGTTSLTTTFTYGDTNELSIVTDPDGRIYTYSYDADGRPTNLAQPNGLTTTYAYDNLGRLTSLVSRHAGTTLASYAYTLEPTGRRTRVDEVDGTARAYGYDALYRLTAETVTGPGTSDYAKTFSYDLVGNRLTQVTTGAGAANLVYAYDSRDRLLSETRVTNTWDDNGNLVGKSGADGAIYEWDFEDRLVRVTKADGTVVEHVYDGDGNRVRTTVMPAVGGAPTITNYLVDTTGSLSHAVAETDGSGVVGAYYIRAGRELLAVRRGAVVRNYLRDGLGSVRELVDASGAVRETRTYSAYGETLASTGSDGQPYGFAGEAFEGVSGLSYNRARWMDPRTGIFLSMDPWAGDPRSPASLGRYLYASGNPVSDVDPSGRMTLGEAAATVTTFTVLGAAANIGLQQRLDKVTLLSAGAEGAKQGFEFGVAFVLAPAVVGALGVAQGIVGIPDLLAIINDPNKNMRQKIVATVLLAAALDGAFGYGAAASGKPPKAGGVPEEIASTEPISAEAGSAVTGDYRVRLGSLKQSVLRAKARRDAAREALEEAERDHLGGVYTEYNPGARDSGRSLIKSLKESLNERQEELDNASSVFDAIWREFNGGMTSP